MPEARLTLAALAGELEVSIDTVRRWQAGGMPGKKRGGRWRFDLEAVRAWRARHERGQSGEGGRADADLRKAVALAELRELDLAKRRGEVISREEIRLALGDVSYSLRTRLLALPDYAASVVEGQPRHEIARMLRAELTSALQILAGMPYAPADAELLCTRCRRELAAPPVAGDGRRPL